MVDAGVTRGAGSIATQELCASTQSRVVNRITDGAGDRSEVAAVARVLLGSLTPPPEPYTQDGQEDAKGNTTNDSTGNCALVGSTSALLA